MATETYRRQPSSTDNDHQRQAPAADNPPTSVEAEAEDMIDTSAMTEGQREALAVAEAAREREWRAPSFAGELFMGRFHSDHLLPFPRQSPSDAAVGDHLCDQVAKLLHDHLDPDAVDRERTIPDTVIDALKGLGVFVMKVPKEYGGLGLSQVNYNRVMMLISSYCASTAVLVSAHQSIGVPQPLKLFGTTAQKERWFTRFKEGAISAFALTEPG
ncbi:MAG: acyl-CoA dehydrogenase family protein, partial [Planctomycetota bacterium]